MSNASIRIEQLMLPTYPEPGKEEMPLFSEHRVHQRSTGRPYPNKVTLEVNRERKIERSYTVVHLENEYLDVLVLPEIGGRILPHGTKSPITISSTASMSSSPVSSGRLAHGSPAAWSSTGPTTTGLPASCPAILKRRNAATAASSAGCPSTTPLTG